MFLWVLVGVKSYGEVASVPSLQVYAEKTPIAFANSETGKGGEATKLIQAILAEANLSYSLEFASWKRAYRLASSQPNTLIYPMARTPEREGKFHWLGRITPVHYYLFSHHKRISQDPKKWAALLRSGVQLRELRELSVGVVNGSLFHNYLLKNQFTELAVVNAGRQNIDKVVRGRIDLFAASSAGLHNLCKVEAIDCSQFEVVSELKELSTGLYFAASKNSRPDVLFALETAYLSVSESGLLSKIMAERSGLEEEDLRLQYFAPRMK